MYLLLSWFRISNSPYPIQPNYSRRPRENGGPAQLISAAMLLAPRRRACVPASNEPRLSRLPPGRSRSATRHHPLPLPLPLHPNPIQSQSGLALRPPPADLRHAHWLPRWNGGRSYAHPPDHHLPFPADFFPAVSCKLEQPPPLAYETADLYVYVRVRRKSRATYSYAIRSLTSRIVLPYCVANGAQRRYPPGGPG
jgi:hypothetical protein